MVTIQRDITFTGLEFCNFSDCNHNFPKHFHDDTYTFSYMVDGGKYWAENNLDSLVKPGDIVTINPGQIHTGRPINNLTATYKNISISKSLLDDLTNDLLLNNEIEFKNVICGNPKNVTLYLNLFRTFFTDSNPNLKEEALLDFLYNIIKHNANNIINNKDIENIDDKRIKLLLDFMKTDLAGKKSLENYSELIGISKFHLLRSFKKYTGLTPHNFRTIYKLEKARNDLLNGVTICDVAQNTGFTDQSHFSKKFKDYYGITPKKFISNK